MDDEIAADRSTAAERVPVRGAYNITDVGDSAKVGWWDDGPVRYTWRSLKWLALGAVGMGVPLWAVLWSPIHWTVLLFIAAVCAYPAFRLFSWYIETADRWATMQLKRKQVRHR